MSGIVSPDPWPTVDGAGMWIDGAWYAAHETPHQRTMREVRERVTALGLPRNVWFRMVVRADRDTGAVRSLRVKRKRYGKRVHRARKNAGQL